MPSFHPAYPVHRLQRRGRRHVWEGLRDALHPGLGPAYPQQLRPQLCGGHAVEPREPVLLDLFCLGEGVLDGRVQGKRGLGLCHEHAAQGRGATMMWDGTRTCSSLRMMVVGYCCLKLAGPVLDCYRGEGARVNPCGPFVCVGASKHGCCGCPSRIPAQSAKQRGSPGRERAKWAGLGYDAKALLTSRDAAVVFFFLSMPAACVPKGQPPLPFDGSIELSNTPNRLGKPPFPECALIAKFLEPRRFPRTPQPAHDSRL